MNQVHRFNDGVLPSKACFDKNILYTSIDLLWKLDCTKWGKSNLRKRKIYNRIILKRKREKKGKKQIRKLKIELRNENRTASRIIAADTHIYPTRLFIHTIHMYSEYLATWIIWHCFHSKFVIILCQKRKRQKNERRNKNQSTNRLLCVIEIRNWHILFKTSFMKYWTKKRWKFSELYK